MNKLIDLESYPVSLVLGRLLQDKTTKQNIIFATDVYAELGPEFTETSELSVSKLLGSAGITIQPRVEKSSSEQLSRTRKKAEVFTPSWIVNKMNNHCDDEWFGRPNVFNTEDGAGWVPTTDAIVFDGKKTWKQYVDSRRIEITCGEAPYVVSRYDTTTGALIPINNRIGILDRKLRVVDENAVDDAEWLKWAERALQSCYGYEFQGDNLLIARINVLNSFVDYFYERFGVTPDKHLLRRLANIICWNFWQMDGLTGTIPFHTLQKNKEQVAFFGFDGSEEEDTPTAPYCKIWDWRRDNAISYETIKGGPSA